MTSTLVALNKNDSPADFEDTRTPAVNFAAMVGCLLGVSVATVGVRWAIGPLNISTLLGMATLVLVVLRHYRRLLSYRPGAIDLAILLFISFMLATELLNAEQLVRKFDPYLCYVWAYYYCAFLAARLAVQSRSECVQLLRGVIFFAPLMSVFAILQSLRFEPVVDLTLQLTSGGAAALGRFSDEDQLVRSTGLIGHWTGFGSYLCVMALIAIVLMRLRGSTYGSVGVLLITGLGIVTTYTFSVILIYVALVVVFYIQEKRPGRLGIFTLLGIVLALSAFGDSIGRRIFQQYGSSNVGAFASSEGLIPETLVYRMRVWTEETIPAILERPITGWGHAVYSQLGEWPIGPTSLVWTSPESQWFGVLMQAGVLGLAALCLVIGSYFVVARRLTPNVRPIVTLFLILCLGVSLTVPQFTNAGLPYALVVFFAAMSFMDRPAQMVGRQY